VRYDVTSSYFEGRGPKDFARHGSSRDGKAQNGQVVIGLVMVAGWPIAHHVWAGNRLDTTTVQEVVSDLMSRFAFRRVLVVGDRGMVSEANLEALRRDGPGYLVGLRRRRNAALDGWLQRLDESTWQDGPAGITAREHQPPLRTRVPEVPSGDPGRRVFVIDADERRRHEQALREQARRRVRAKRERLQARVARGPRAAAASGAAAERAVRGQHGYRYYTWESREGALVFREHPLHLEREKRLEGKYGVVTSEPDVEALQAVAWYKELADVERGFRHLKDVLALRPIYHRVEPRVKAPIFVAALALLVQTLRGRRLQEAGVALSAAEAFQAVQTIRQVTFRVGQEARSGVSAACPRARQVLQAVGLNALKPPVPPTTGEPTVR
jgi:transposase